MIPDQFHTTLTKTSVPEAIRDTKMVKVHNTGSICYGETLKDHSSHEATWKLIADSTNILHFPFHKRLHINSP